MSWRSVIRQLLCGLLVVCFAGTLLADSSDKTTTGGKTIQMRIASKVFNDNGAIPKMYTCDGQDISPPLEWTTIPPETQSLALIVEDPDAPKKVWTHWVIYDLPPDATGLSEEVPHDKELKNKTRQGINDYGKIGWGGPCPPSGTHRYYFTLYALNAKLHLEAGATKDQLLKAMQGHILEEAKLMGTYKRSK